MGVCDNPIERVWVVWLLICNDDRACVGVDIVRYDVAILCMVWCNIVGLELYCICGGRGFR